MSYQHDPLEQLVARENQIMQRIHTCEEIMVIVLDMVYKQGDITLLSRQSKKHFCPYYGSNKICKLNFFVSTTGKAKLGSYKRIGLDSLFGS